MSEKNSNSCSFRTSIGGQALMEGILMRGPKKQAIVCRTKDGLVEKVEELKLDKQKHPILGWPFIRGCAIFLDSMVKGMQALTYSASLLPEEEQEEPDKLDRWIMDHFPAEKAQKLIIGTAVYFSREQEPEVSMAMTSSSRRFTSLYSKGSIKGIF